jgi:DHA2 family lincomycin resistance protein-like MFS transporter
VPLGVATSNLSGGELKISGGTDATSIANGARAAFTVGAVLAVVALVTAVFLPRHTRNADED